jgi:hypothetical protein
MLLAMTQWVVSDDQEIRRNQRSFDETGDSID